MKLAGLAPTRTELVPWTDKRGRVDRLRAATFTLLLAPGIWIAVRWGAHMLGPEPVNAAIHATGFWGIWLLLASLTISPARALAWSPGLVVIRRMVGNAAFAYVAIHLMLYATDQHWRLWTIGSEILLRFYLTIGFVALVALFALALTSTDGWSRALGRTWKRLHRLAYAIAVLGLVHYILQSKLNVSQALLAVGVFGWLMLWRALPAGRDREWLPLLGITLLAAAATLVCEYAWYRFGTHSDPVRVVLGEFDIAFGLQPAGQVLFLGLIATLLTELRRLAATRLGATALFNMAVFALASLAAAAAALFTGWQPDDPQPGDIPTWLLTASCAVVLAVLGWLRWRARDQLSRDIAIAALLATLSFEIITPGPPLWHLELVLVATTAAAVAQVIRRTRLALPVPEGQGEG